MTLVFKVLEGVREKEEAWGRADWELLVVLKAVWRESSINRVPAYFLP